MNGKLADEVLTTTTRPGRPATSSAHCADSRSAPTRLNLASTPSKVPWPMSTMKSRSSRVMARRTALRCCRTFAAVAAAAGVGRIGQHLQMLAIDLHPLDEHGGEIAGPRRVLHRVLLPAARPGHDERVAFAGNGRRGLREENGERRGDGTEDLRLKAEATINALA